MASLDRTLRRGLENTVKQARRVAEAGARKAVEQSAVHEAKAWPSLTERQKRLRNRLRAHGRQLGDQRDERRDTQTIDRLVGECAYEHWHRMLFARFLAENNLLIEPETGVAITLEECQELAREQGADWLELASGYAVRMLRQIFRPDDPVLEVALPPETTSALEDLLKKLPCDVFTAGDSLGWCYQFWQAERKDEVNAAGNKIGADELPAVTQLFTEDYMVDFLLDNTLGAWHAGKILTANPALAETAQSEEALRNAVVLPGCPWKYLRFIKGNDGRWTPAAGTFDRWPKTAKELTCLDPCMGSGHFVVAMFERIVALRMAEEGLDEKTAMVSVIHDNLFGLEIDPRCTQIGAFNLALSAWRRVGYCTLPPMNIACSGLAPNTREADWLAIAGEDEKLRNGMARLYGLFKDAPILGSLINPRAAGGDLLVAAFHELQPLLEKVLAQETQDDIAYDLSAEASAKAEMAVTARGLAKAAEILAGHVTLVATNVPYLARGKQDEPLKEYCERIHPESKADIATCFVERCLDFCVAGGSTSLVTPQNWLFLGNYTKLRQRLLSDVNWNFMARLGENGFDSSQAAGAFTALFALTRTRSPKEHSFLGLDVSDETTPEQKNKALLASRSVFLNQYDQLANPDARISLERKSEHSLLEVLADCYQGISPADFAHFGRMFWELRMTTEWRLWQSTVDDTENYGGRVRALWWNNDFLRAVEDGSAYIRGEASWRKLGVAVSAMRELPCTLYLGEPSDTNVAIIIPKKKELLAAIWCFCCSPDYNRSVRAIDQALKVTNATLVKVPFDLVHWQKVAAEKYPHGLPKPFSSDPKQWLFNGHPTGSDQPLHVAVARLLGYQWPRQTGSSFTDCPALGPDGLETLADEDGIVCLSATKGEAPAAARLRALLATAFGSEWSAGKERELLGAAESRKTSLEDWLLDEFFEQHSTLFHHRPFVWHLWDGRRDGFNVLVNYHKLSGPNGEGRRTLEKLVYAYLGDWITLQRRDQQAGAEGADARLAAALQLQKELKKILEGDPPYDLFVRWKPLHEQAIGWDPDINDGVRLNIRPFMTARPLYAKAKNACILRTTPKIKWDKDRGKEPRRPKEDYPWFWGWDEKAQDFTGKPGMKEPDGNRWNDLHYTNAVKQVARERREQ